MLPDIGEAAVQAASVFRKTSLQYGPLRGLPELRTEIVKLLGEDGVQAAIDNVLIVNGAKAGIELALKLFIEKGDTIIVTRPNYATALHIFRNHEASFLEIGMDGDGLIPEELERKLNDLRIKGAAIPKLLYIVPDFHNPTGVTLSEARRRRLVELAGVFDFYIIEDDPYRHVTFGGPLLHPIHAFDNDGRVIGVGTVSKIFAPGIRIGWVHASKDIIARMAAMKSDGGCSPFIQYIVTSMLRSGEIKRHTQELSAELKVHHDTMVRALQEFLPELKFIPARGGYYLWAQLPDGMDCDVLATEAEQSGVTIFSGKPYFADRKTANFIRLCFSNSKPAEIERGINILSDVVKRLHNSANATPMATASASHFD
ncbi:MULTISPECIES: PLP-dependent aminotransferase family protein [unclassified Mesorhizobium]|nr:MULTISPECIES: PLP-dependent aminotransferase family protein [unclassified Mesorhizobium]